MTDFFGSTLFKATAALVLGAIVLRFLYRLLFPPKMDALHLRVRCTSCGWKGSVGKYMKKCSKCNADTLEVLKG